MAGKAAAVALAKKPYIKYWIAGDDYEYGHAIADASWRNLKEMKPKVEKIGESWWKPGEPDLIPYLTAIMAANPDAVIFTTGGRSMANVLKAVKTTGMSEKIPVLVHTATDHAVLKPLGTQAPEGVMGTMDYHFYYPDTAANKAFVEAFEAAARKARPTRSSCLTPTSGIDFPRVSERMPNALTLSHFRPRQKSDPLQTA